MADDIVFKNVAHYKFLYLIGKKKSQFPCCDAATIKYIVYSNTKQDFMEQFHWEQILKILLVFFVEYLLTKEKNV